MADPERTPAELHVDVGGLTAPDVATVGRLARLQLLARRRGFRVVLRDAGPQLRDLLGLCGLAGAVPSEPPGGLPVERRGQPEQREEPGSVEEGGEAADPPV